MRARWLLPVFVAVAWTDTAGAQSVTYPYPADYPLALRHASPGLCDPREQHACVPDKCYEVVQQAINGPNCGNISAGFPLTGLDPMYTDVGYQPYAGPLKFLGCVPSSDNTCQVHILGVGAKTTVKDACNMPRPGCYFALSQGNFGTDLNAACATANSAQKQPTGALKLVNPQDRQCIQDMVTAGQQNTANPKKLACHSWGTAFCSQNGFTDAEYYGGLCPTGSTCAHNQGDRTPCAIYNCAINNASPAGNLPALLSKWSNSNWGSNPTYTAPDIEHCLEGSVWKTGDRHANSEYLSHRDKNPGSYTAGALNKTSRTTTSVCASTHEHAPPIRTSIQSGEAP